MAARDVLSRAEPRRSLPVLERLAPPPPPEIVAARIESHTRPGDVIADLHGRGGWIARAGLDRQRRALSVESSPLTRLLAEIVLRPPDIRHLDAAFQAIGGSPHGRTSLKLWVGELFATRCPTCERTVTLDELIWESIAGSEQEPVSRPVRKHYRCQVCRDRVGGSEQRHAAADDSDADRARSIRAGGPTWELIHERFPAPPGAERLVDELLDLHSPRQLLALAAILERIEGDLRAAPIQAALRLALMGALLPSTRLNGFPGRVASLRISGGRVRRSTAEQWRERNPWLAFEDGFRLVRGFVQRLEGSPSAPVQARFGDDLRSLAEGVATTVVRLGTQSTFRSLELEARDRRPDGEPRVRLVLGQPPVRPNQERISFAYFATGWLLGREAASLLPLETLVAPPGRAPWGWQSGALRRALAAIAPWLASEARVVLLLEGSGAEPLVAAALGGAAAGYRLVGARLGEPGEESGGIVELAAPGAAASPVARTRANVQLPSRDDGTDGAQAGGSGSAIFAPPERYRRAAFSPNEAARIVSDTAVEILQARGEPAHIERLLGDVLVGLDRAGQLRRLVGVSPDGETSADDRRGSLDAAAPPEGHTTRTSDDQPASVRSRAHGLRRPEPSSSPATTPHVRRLATRDVTAVAELDQVEQLHALIRDELTRPGHRRLREIEPGRWWLADPRDEAAAQAPLADRVEWAVFSLLSTGGPLSEAAFLERIASLFTGHDLPDEALVRACLESYRSLASTRERLLTTDDLLERSREHTELLALLAETGHRLGLRVWLGLREQSRRMTDGSLGDRLDDAERDVYLPLVTRAPAEPLEQVDCIWYVRGKLAMLFEVEWTAMLAEPLLRHHTRIPQDDNLVRFLVIAPERTELVRHKLARSPLLRAAFERDNWHVLKANQLRAWAARDGSTLDDLEPYLGLDPAIERTGEQMALFGG